VSLSQVDSPAGADILVVEDDPGLARLVTKLLERDGLAVRLAPSGQAAIELLAEKAPELMLLDYSLPDMRGDQLIEKLAQLNVCVP
jgi:two-component system response regulator BaeR